MSSEKGKITDRYYPEISAIKPFDRETDETVAGSVLAAVKRSSIGVAEITFHGDAPSPFVKDVEDYSQILASELTDMNLDVAVVKLHEGELHETAKIVVSERK